MSKPLYLFGNGVDLVIAESAEEAQYIFQEPYGDDDRPYRVHFFEREPDDKVFALGDEEDPDAPLVSKTAAQWVADNPTKMLLASADLYGDD